MPRPLRPWFHSRKNAWVIEPQGKLVKLADGPKNAVTKKAAEVAFHRYMAELSANPPVDNDNPTVASVIEAFLQHDEKHSSPRTYAERKRILQRFAEEHGRRLVKECKAFHLSSWIDSHPVWSNPWTRSYVVRCVKRPFNWAMDEDLIARNPFRGVKHGSGDPRRPMNEDEYHRLLEACGKNSRLGRMTEILRFMYLTGCRPGEVTSLRWTDLDLEQGVIVLKEHKTKRTRKDRPDRRGRATADRDSAA